jgi:hypothetical protein
VHKRNHQHTSMSWHQANNADSTTQSTTSSHARNSRLTAVFQLILAHRRCTGDCPPLPRCSHLVAQLVLGSITEMRLRVVCVCVCVCSSIVRAWMTLWPTHVFLTSHLAIDSRTGARDPPAEVGRGVVLHLAPVLLDA